MRLVRPCTVDEYRVGVQDGRDYMQNMHRFHDWRRELFALKGWKRTIKAVGGPAPELNTIDPAVIRHVLSDSFDRYTKSSRHEDYLVELMHEFLGDGGIFVLQHGQGPELDHPDANELWLQQRKTASKIFTQRNFRELMGKVFEQKAAVVMRLLDEHCARNAGTLPLDAQQLFFAFTMDSAYQIFFGRDECDTLNGSSLRFAAAFDGAHRAMLDYMFSNISFIVLAGLLPFPFGTLHWFRGPVGIAQHLHRLAHPVARTFAAHCKTLARESTQIIRRRRLEMARSGNTRADLLTLFMLAKTEEGKAARPYTDSALHAIVMSFIIAGRDTTACLLSWTTYILSTHAHVQAELCAEVDRVLRHLRPDAAPTIEQLSASAMPYLNGVVFEALRLYPPVPEDYKVCNAEAGDTLPDGTHVPHGVHVNFLPYVMGRDPHRYANPDTVQPERWIPFVQPSPYDFPVFQAGPRICLGQQMALYEAKLLLVQMLRRFTFSLEAGEQEKITYSNTLTMAVCNSKAQDSHQLLVHPQPRHPK